MTTGHHGGEGEEALPPQTAPGPATLFHDVYEDLHRVAGAYMRRQVPSHTLQPTDLVNEAYVKLAGKHGSRWTSRQHFLAEAARTMRSVLVDHARAKGSLKRKPPGRRVALDLVIETLRGATIDILDLDEALTDLAASGDKGAQAARVAELRIIAGLSMKEVAETTGTPLRSVERLWAYAQACLRKRLA